jgi:dihydroorotase
LPPVDVVRWAKARGIAVTAEVTPHHLLLTEELARSYDPRFKVNPPLRRTEDVLALRAALGDGTIDIVATDHAPHPTEAKECTWGEASFGMIGLESALSVVQDAVIDTGIITWVDLARVFSSTPAAIGRLEGYDRPLEVGSPANITLIYLTYSRVWSVDHLSGRSTNTPYLGRQLPGRVLYTVHNGALTVDDGMLTEPEALVAAHQGVTRG